MYLSTPPQIDHANLRPVCNRNCGRIGCVRRVWPRPRRKETDKRGAERPDKRAIEHNAKPIKDTRGRNNGYFWSRAHFFGHAWARRPCAVHGGGRLRGQNPRHDVGGFVTNVGITFELKELIPWGESRVALGYADGYSRPQPVPLHVAAWLFRAQMKHVAGRK